MSKKPFDVIVVAGDRVKYKETLMAKDVEQAKVYAIKYAALLEEELDDAEVFVRPF